MPRGDQSADSDQQKSRGHAADKSHEPRGAGPKAEARAWPTVNKLQGGGKKFDARRKVPSGPIGGSGRKTNLSRSS